MKKEIISIATLLSLAMPVMAQEPAAARPREAREELRKDVRDLRENVKGEVKDLRKDVMVEAQKLREGLKGATRDVKADIRDTIKDKREDLREAVKVKRDEAKEKINKEREEFKARLAKLKDERKKKIAENVEKQLHALNERMMDHYMDVLGKLKSSLSRIEERIAKAEARGLDVSEPKRLAVLAKAAIASAEEAVKAQAAKTYPIVFTDEATMKTAITAARKALHEDLRKIHEKVKDAREAVRNVAVALAKIVKPADRDDRVATTTPATTTQSN